MTHFDPGTHLTRTYDKALELSYVGPAIVVVHEIISDTSPGTKKRMETFYGRTDSLQRARDGRKDGKANFCLRKFSFSVTGYTIEREKERERK